MNNLIKYLCLFIVLGTISSLCMSCSDDDKSDSTMPMITDFFPKEGLPFTEVKITGSNFGENASKGGTVYFNETKATEYVSYSDNEIIVKVPEGASSGSIAVLFGEKYAFTDDQFTYIPGATIESLSPAVAPLGETISIFGKNFFNVGLDNIKVDFNGGLGTVISLTSDRIDVIVPDNAVSGPVTITFGDIQTLVGPDFTIGEKPIVADDIVFELWDYVTTFGNIIIDPKPQNGMGSTKDGAYVIYEFTVPADAKYDVSLLASTNQTYNTYINVDMATDVDALKDKVVDNALSQKVTKQGWNTFEQLDYGTFVLKSGTTYYIKLTFLAEGTSWVANVSDLRVVLAEDQTADGIEVGSGKTDYTIYQNDFNTGMMAPFSPRWDWSPSYIKIVNQYLEFHFDQAALDADDRRERRGAEVVCNFKTTTEGWYGFKFFLPEGEFPKNVETHIAQIFQNGDCNSWAGFLSIKDQYLEVRRRSNCYPEITPEKVTDISWNTWIPVIIHFKVSMMNTGMFQVWVGNNPDKNNPTYNATNINFGFGEWKDGETLDDVVSEQNAVADYIGCKFGMYCFTGGDRTIRFDDLKVLEGNPSGAFDLVNPGN
jgi:hypothetical protein